VYAYDMFIQLYGLYTVYHLALFMSL